MTRSVFEFLRRAVQRVLSVGRPTPWMRYAGMIETGDPSASQKIDDVVYGQKD